MMESTYISSGLENGIGHSKTGEDNNVFGTRIEQTPLENFNLTLRTNHNDELHSKPSARYSFLKSPEEGTVHLPNGTDIGTNSNVPTADELTNYHDTRKGGNERAEIHEGSIKNRLHEIINEIDLEVTKRENVQHTWKPKGQYEMIKTPIKYEDVVPCQIPDIVLPEKKMEIIPPPPEVSRQKRKTPKELPPMDPIIIPRHPLENGGNLAPMEIPAGIPLLARVLPKEDHDQSVDHHEKIPLERLFTPAKDATEIVPQKKKKAFASSCFYSPDHPTIDDQVELAHKISVSLMDENNKTSKGQTMYMKRKNKSAKWIHQAGQNGSEEVEEEKKPSLEKPPLKLLLSPKGVQDYSAVQQHYEDLMAAAEATVTPPPLKIDISKQIGSTDLETLESPTGKGAALFAKRKKRMDKFIVDETTVQQQSRNSTIDGHSFNRSNQPACSIGNSSSPVDPFHGLGEDMTFSGGLSEGNTFYTADVKVVQKTSLPTTPSTDFGDFAAHFSLLDDFSEMKNEDKRKSFNLAAKGWGTYGNFYTPLHFEV